MTRGEAARKTVDALWQLGRIEPVDSALINELIATADALDNLNPSLGHYSSLVRAYTAIEAKVHARLCRNDDNADGPTSVSDLLAALGD